MPISLSRRDAAAGALLAALATGAASAAQPARCCPVVELRQYTLRRGRRDELIALFEREFVESQEAVGAHVLGTFTDRDDPDRFVWLRGFESMAARERALSAFYGGPVWAAHRTAANATILDSDNVLLLHPVPAGGGFDLAAAAAPAALFAVIHAVDEPLLPPFAAFFEQEMRPRIAQAGGAVLAAFESETSANTFPRLPVRERDRVFVWFAHAADGDAFLQRLHGWQGWRDAAPESLLPAFFRKPEILRLQPTSRSKLR